MAWQDLAKRPLVITTGDGVEYVGLWVNGTNDFDINHKVYNFIDKQGSFVDRKQIKSRKFPLEFYFDGDNHFETQNRFMQSCVNTNFWTVNHPVYGIITGQPLKVAFDNSSLNVTRVNVTFHESIGRDLLIASRSPVERIQVDTVELLISASDNIVPKIEPSVEDVPNINNTINDISENYEGLADNEFRTLVSIANASVSTYLDDVALTVNNIQNLLRFPILATGSVFTKLAHMISVLNGLRKSDKEEFEIYGATILGSILSVAVSGDFKVRSEVINLINQIRATYNGYLSDLETNTETQGYIPDRMVQTQLHDLYVETMFSLFQISFGAMTEIEVVLTEDSNIFLEAYKYGFLENDERLVEFKDLNGIIKDDLFELKKGRSVKFFR